MASEPPVSAARPGRGRRPRRRPWPGALRAELVAFLALSLFSLLAVTAAAVLFSERIARDNQLRDAQNTTSRMAHRLIEPLMSDVLNGVPGKREELDGIVHARLLDGSATVVLVWTPQGSILWSSDRRLEGKQETPLSPLLQAALRGQTVSDLDPHPELSGPNAKPLLEVYTPMTVNGQRYAFEAYYSAANVERDTATLRGRIVPLTVGALAVLQLLQIPLVVSLGLRLSRHEADRTALARRSLMASDRERRAIAADVHDGPVQDLAGISYALSAVRSSVPEAQRATMDRMVAAVRSARASLRRLMIDIYPPDLSGGGLATALHDLAVPLREQGLVVTVEIDDDLPVVSAATAAVVYRTAKEALANVSRHAKAQQVWICLEEATLRGALAVRLTIADDGVGFGPRGPDDPMPVSEADDEGHLGLRLVHDRVIDAGGTVQLRNRPDGGAVIDALLPVDQEE